MKADVSRADLLKYLAARACDMDAASEAGHFESIADCFGFQFTRQIQQSYVLNVDDIYFSSQNTIEVKAAQSETEARPPERFWRLTQVKQSDLAPAIDEEGENPLPDWMKNLPDMDFLNAPVRKQNTEQRLKLDPLLPWSRLWPVLRDMLTEQQIKKRPDLPRLVKTIAQGELPKRIPQQQRQNWTAGLRILIDRPQRLRLFNHDFLTLIRQLKKLRGQVGLIEEMLDDHPGGAVFRQNQKHLWRMPEPETPLLILSDLGIYDASGQAEKQWLAFGRKLQAAGCKAYVLMPVPSRYLSEELAGYYCCISWDRFSSLQIIKGMNANSEAISKRKDQDQKAYKPLLVWLSALVELEPELLRAIRHQLFDKPLDVSFEAWVWNHEDILGNTTHISFDDQSLPQLRDDFLRQAKLDQAQTLRLLDLVERFHSGKFLLDYYEEINGIAIALSPFVASVQGDRIEKALKEAEAHIQQFIRAVYENKDHQGLIRHGHALLERQPLGIKGDQACLSSLWGIQASRSTEPMIRPAWLRLADAYPFLNQKQVKQSYRLLQKGEALYICSEASIGGLMETELDLPLLTLAKFDAGGSLLLEERMFNGQVFEQCDHQLKDNGFIQLSQLSIPAGVRGFSSNQIEQRRLHVNGLCHMLGKLPKPSWANSIGRDQQGLYVTAPWLNEPRLDWQERLIDWVDNDWWSSSWTDLVGHWSGHESLGVDEYGLYVDLDIKGVVQRFRWIEPGTFLMGSPKDEVGRFGREVQHEVTLTQGFWLADTTVTQALWLALMGHNPSEFKGENRPVEKVSWGDAQDFISKLNEIIPGINAQLPSEAQWEYACRAGTQGAFNFEGELSLDKVNYRGIWEYESDKWGEGALQKTVDVKSYACNAWGLYQMHGNVWEWCQDFWSDGFPTEPITNPKGPVEGSGRVVRGGSWFSDGRIARSACRFRFVADDRNFSLGFRLALGLELRSSQAGRAAN